MFAAWPPGRAPGGAPGDITTWLPKCPIWLLKMFGPSGTSSFFLLPRPAASRGASSTPTLDGGGGPKGIAPGGGKPGGICRGLKPGLMKGGGGTPGGKEGGGMPMGPGKTGGCREPTPTIGCCIGGTCVGRAAGETMGTPCGSSCCCWSERPLWVSSSGRSRAFLTPLHSGDNVSTSSIPPSFSSSTWSSLILDHGMYVTPSSTSQYCLNSGFMPLFKAQAILMAFWFTLYDPRLSFCRALKASCRCIMTI